MLFRSRGGSSADVWVMTDGEVDVTTLLPGGQAAPVSVQRNRVVTSRAAENLFWLGRYTERTENTTRLARLIIETLNGESPTPPELLHWLDATARVNSLVLSSVPALEQSRRVFERALIAELGDVERGGSVGFSLSCIRRAAAAVRERLSQDHWNQIVRAEAD